MLSIQSEIRPLSRFRCKSTMPFSISPLLHLSVRFPAELGRPESLDDHGEPLDPHVALVHRPHPDHPRVATRTSRYRKQLQNCPGENGVCVERPILFSAGPLVSLAAAAHLTRSGRHRRRQSGQHCKQHKSQNLEEEIHLSAPATPTRLRLSGSEDGDTTLSERRMGEI